MAGMAGQWGRKTGGRKMGGKFGSGGEIGDKISKPINKKYEDGNLL